MNKTLDWVRSMEQPGGGLSAWEDGSQHAAYPECTGYIIPTLYDYGEGELAGRCADWLCSIQNPEGWWGGIHVSTPQTFDTAAIVEGLRRAYDETGEDRYVEAADRALTWLWKLKGEYSTLPTEPGKDTQIYTARAAWIMEDHDALEYWLPSTAWDPRWGYQQRPHYIAYALEGLHNSGYDIRHVLEGARVIEGLFPFYASYWKRVTGTDTSATIQMAILYVKNGMSIDHLQPAIEKQVTARGGLRHSEGETRMTIWTAKYYLDLMKLLNKSEKRERVLQTFESEPE